MEESPILASDLPIFPVETLRHPGPTSLVFGEGHTGNSQPKLLLRQIKVISHPGLLHVEDRYQLQLFAG
jgi:hypothetical protein